MRGDLNCIEEQYLEQDLTYIAQIMDSCSFPCIAAERHWTMMSSVWSILVGHREAVGSETPDISDSDYYIYMNGVRCW